MSTGAEAGWGTCSTCGDAMPPRAVLCPTCGKEYSRAPSAVAPTGGVRRRLRLHRGLRMAIVLGVALALSGVMAVAAWQGPPVAPDPLTGHWFFSLGPGNHSSFSGAITGGDYVTGNFSVITPPGALVILEVYNATEYGKFLEGLPAATAQSPAQESNGLVDFSALVTDSYYFVWVNPYPAASHIVVGVYAATEYMSNVVVE